MSLRIPTAVSRAACTLSTIWHGNKTKLVFSVCFVSQVWASFGLNVQYVNQTFLGCIQGSYFKKDNLFCARLDQMINIYHHPKVKLEESPSGEVYVHHLRVNFKMPKLCSHKIATVWTPQYTFLPRCKWRKTTPSQVSLHDLCNFCDLCANFNKFN